MVSVIVPIYNSEQYLDACISSILQQDYEDMEILLVDDGSTDGSRRIAQDFASRDQRVSYHYKEHSGLAETRKFALGLVKGEFIQFVDSDDTVLPGMIKDVVEHFEDDIDVVVFGMESPDGGYYLPNIEEHRFQFVSTKERVDYIVDYILSHKIFFSLCNKMYRTSIFTENDIWPVSNVKIGEDLALNLQIFLHIKGVKAISANYYQYWFRQNSMMNETEFHYYFNDFVNMLQNLYKKNISKVISQNQYTTLFVKTMENQYLRREKKTSRFLYRADIKKIEDRKFFIASTVKALCSPWIFMKYYIRVDIIRRWYDHFCGLWCCLTKGE